MTKPPQEIFIYRYNKEDWHHAKITDHAPSVFEYAHYAMQIGTEQMGVTNG